VAAGVVGEIEIGLGGRAIALTAEESILAPIAVVIRAMFLMLIELLFEFIMRVLDLHVEFD
jgi:hypothetical protein